MIGDTTVKKEVTITAKTTELALEEAAKQLDAFGIKYYTSIEDVLRRTRAKKD